MSTATVRPDTAKPPEPVFEDGRTGIAVWVNGGYVEISCPEFSRLDPSEAVAFVLAFTAAVTDAAEWALRWNQATRAYHQKM